MTEPVNDDLLPEHVGIDAALAAARREHAERLAKVLNLDAGLAAILTQNENADHDEPAAGADFGALASSRPRPPLPGGQVAVIIAMRIRTRALANGLADVCARGRQVNRALAGAADARDHAGRALADRYLASLHAHRAIRALADFLTDALHLVGDLALDLAGAREAAGEITVDLALDRDRADAGALANALDRALGGDLAAALDRALAAADDLGDLGDLGARAGELVAALDREFGGMYKRADAVAGELAGDLDRVVDRARDLDRHLQSALSCAEELAVRLHAGEVDASGADLAALDLTDMSVLEGIMWTEETTWPPGVHEQVQLRSREIRPGVYQVQGGSERDPSELIIT
jgi:hypothetical protein